MNEKDMLLIQKIEKREKFDTILAYVLLVILLVCIGIVLYLKFVSNEESNVPEEYVPTYISLSEISTSLNSSLLANRYMNDSVNFSSNVSGNSLVVTYVKENKNINLNIPVVGNELMVTIDKDNSDVITDIYKEIANIICMYYGNQENRCRNTLNIMGEDSIDGIRYVNTDNSNVVYITFTKSFSVSNENIYNTVTKVGLNEKKYTIKMFDTKIYNINVLNDNTSIKFSGSVERLTEDSFDVSVVVKLYDINGNVLGENKYEYNKENVLEKTGTFEIVFLLNNELKIENIRTYSIEIVK